MRYKKRNLIARKNKILPIQFVRQDMTTYSGLTLIDHYFRLIGLYRRISKSFEPYDFKGDYSIGHILYMLLVMLLAGAERFKHLDYIKNDPLFQRVIRLNHIPHRTKVSTALKQFTSDSLKALIELNSELVVEKLEELGLNEITIDLDGTVISTRGNPSWAFKGKHIQLELFSPNNGEYEYSAVVTDNKDWSPKELLDFVSGRSAQENSIGQLKTHFAFDHIPTNHYQANSAYMQMSQMAYNLSISMQHSMGLSKKQPGENGKSTRIYSSMKWGTFKFLILNRAGKIAWDKGRKVLQMTQNSETKKLYEGVSKSLEKMELKKAA